MFDQVCLTTERGIQVSVPGVQPEPNWVPECPIILWNRCFTVPDIPFEIKLERPKIPEKIEVQPDTKVEIGLGLSHKWYSGYGFVNWDEVSDSRSVICNLIYELPEVKRQMGSLGIPMWIGCPPSEYVSKVRHEAVSIFAYRYWEESGKAEGHDEDFWHAGEKRFLRAFFLWM